MAAWRGSVTVTTNLADGPLSSLLADGVIAGAGAVLVFLPQILILFFFILALEDSGYLPRAAYLLDRLMGWVGLSGRAFIPLLSSHACAIPGIMATRTIPGWRDRLTTIMIAPLMACSARLPVYLLLIGAFIPHRGGPVQPAGADALRAVRGGNPFLAHGGLGHEAIRGRAPVFAADARAAGLPVAACRQPVAGTVGARADLREPRRRHHPRADDRAVVPGRYPAAAGATGPAIQYSFAGQLGAMLEHVFAPIGFNWQISIALVPGLAAREVAVGALGTVYAMSATGMTCRPARARDRQWLESRHGLFVAGLVRVRAAMPVDARGREARNQLVALPHHHGGLSVRAGLHRLVHHLPRRRVLGVRFDAHVQ